METNQYGFINHATRVFDHFKFNPGKLMEHNLPPIGKKDIGKFISEYSPDKQILISKLMSYLYLDELFPGDLEDFNMISTIFKCTIHIVNPIPIDYTSHTKSLYKWKLQFTKCKFLDFMSNKIDNNQNLFIFHQNKTTNVILKCNKKRNIPNLIGKNEANKQPRKQNEIAPHNSSPTCNIDTTNIADKIIWIKVIIVYNLVESIITENTIEWYILCENESQKSYLYKPIAEELLQVILGEDGNYKTSQWVRKCNKSFCLENFIQKKAHEHAIDIKDPHFDLKNFQFGELLKPNPFYIDTSGEELYSENAPGTISAIRYNNNTKKFIGLIKLPGGISIKEPLSVTWLKENFSEEMIQNWMKKSVNNKLRYTNIPPGSSNVIPSLYVNANNPTIKFLQMEEKTCAYDSFSSVLYHLGYNNEAELLQTFKNNFAHKICVSMPSQVMQNIIQFVIGSSSMKKFTSKYLCKKINSSFRVMKWNFSPGEIIFSTLWTVDGDIGHAVCIYDKYIFDSNTHHALDLSQENLNVSCIGIFSNLHIGYLFHYRSDDKNEFLSKLHNNKML
jgi:hypothetical protein